MEWGSYNTRRYSRPWIARVTEWAIGRGPELEFGGNIGAHMVEIEAAPGALVKFGQKDTRRGNGTENEFGIVRGGGEVERVGAVRAREHWLAGCPDLDTDSENVVAFSGKPA